ncbi:MAG: magnesium chelatase subunit D [bacterium]|jgi:magnesium chelatase subunit D|nr:magnesium chelatase subunit D [Betaproteobacteria bacterium]
MPAPAPRSPWADAMDTLALFAVDPHGLGGVLLRARAGPVRDRWLQGLREALPASAPVRRIPLQIGDGRLLGGLDLAATLNAGRPVAERGLLAEVDGGIALVAMAERIGTGIAAKIAAALDHAEIRIEREGFSTLLPTRFGVVALDESAHEDESVPAALVERLAFLVDLGDLPLREAIEPAPDRDAVEAARATLPSVLLDDEMLEALCGTALALGIDSPRATIAAIRAARASAALAGRDRVLEADASLAARLVFAPRATRIPADPQAEPEPPAEEPPPPPPPPDDRPDESPPDEQTPAEDQPLDDRVLEAVKAAIPAGLLALLQAGLQPKQARSAGGRSGAMQRGQRRGRPAGSRPGDPRSGQRLAVVDTLRAAAPWQPLRKREREASAGAGMARTGRRIDVRRDDFRVQRYRERAQTTTIFAVDASGSQALNRLAEAKGAVELLLADCYVRRDQVALIAFRGPGAEVVLPPTRSLTRAKRSLAGLPGGGGTPLASGIDASRLMADSVRRKGDSAVLVMITDGRGNLARDGRPDRERAQADALLAAAELRLCGVQALLIDTGPRPQPAAEKIAAAMGACYLALPYADSAALSGAVRQVVASETATGGRSRQGRGT